MKKFLFFICYMLIVTASVSAQKYEPVTVRAGMRVVDYFPFSERYRYPEFVSGRIQLKGGVFSDLRINYDMLSAEIVYVRGKDTVAIGNPKDLRFVSAALDTFYFNKGFYFELIYGGSVKVGLKQYIKLKEVLKQDSYGSTSSGSAINSYGSLPSQGSFYRLTANSDMLFQRTLEYYLIDKSGEFTQFTKKNVMQLFPQSEDKIKAYLKTNKVNFEKREDLIRMAEFLSGL